MHETRILSRIIINFFCLRGECGKILKFKVIIWGVLGHDEGLGL